MINEDQDVAIENIIKRLEKLETFTKDLRHLEGHTNGAIDGIDERLEKLETFKKDTILDINEYDEYLDKLTDHLNTLESNVVDLEKRTIEAKKRTDYPEFKDTVRDRLNKDDAFHNAMVNEISDMDRVSELLKEEVKDKIVRNFLELNKDINGDQIDDIMEIAIHKRTDINKADLEDAEEVYWACKILLEYVGNNFEEWRI